MVLDLLGRPEPLLVPPPVLAPFGLEFVAAASVAIAEVLFLPLFGPGDVVDLLLAVVVALGLDG